MKVLQLSQFSSSKEITKLNFEEEEINQKRNICEYDETDSPCLGYVWYIKGTNRLCELYKANYDSSD
jgi:hypothetical protein